MLSVCDVSAFPLIAFRKWNVFQHAPETQEVDPQEQQGLNYSDNGDSRSISKVTLGGHMTRFDDVVKTPRWKGKKEQKETMKPVMIVKEAKENTAVKPPPQLEGIKKTTVKTTPVVQENKGETTVRPAPWVEEAKEKTTVKPLPREKGGKEKATVEPPSVVKGAQENNTSEDQTKSKVVTGPHENNTSEDQAKPKAPPASMKTARPTPQAAAVTQKRKLSSANFTSEPQWDFEDEYLLDNSSPPSVGGMVQVVTKNGAFPLTSLSAGPWACVPFAAGDDFRAGRSLTVVCRCWWDPDRKTSIYNIYIHMKTQVN